jgi:glycosyltransferase involved in cell wall biosynthesis
LRARGREVTLTIAGHRDDIEYGTRLEALAAARPWFRLIYDLTRADLARLIASHRYGIHTMENEHFGIGPAEIQRAGCLLFVHNSGGPVEIVDGDAGLTFDRESDAVEKIGRAIEDRKIEQELRRGAASRAERFTTERFCGALRQVVAGFE